MKDKLYKLAFKLDCTQCVTNEPVLLDENSVEINPKWQEAQDKAFAAWQEVFREFYNAVIEYIISKTSVSNKVANEIYKYLDIDMREVFSSNYVHLVETLDDIINLTIMIRDDSK